jgi:2,3-bisphosphoglycerate-independent phosphoglycerate mutase
MKGIFVIMDGVADKPCQVLGNITPLQAAKTPNLDALAKKGKLDYCYTVKEGYSPESDAGVISLLGYDFVFEQRGPLEALGVGVKLTNGDLAFRCNFATIDDLDRRAGRNLTTKEARVLANAINENVKLPFPFEFIPTIQHRAVLVIRGGFSDNISNVDVDKKGKLAFAHSEDDDDESAELSAEVLNSFIRQSHKILDDHAINLVRSRKGFYSANAILCRGAGSKVPRFKKLKGRWMGLGYMPLEKGIAKATGMESYNFRYPKLKGIDAYANLYDGLKAATKYAGRMISWYKKKQDYFYVHFKECDLPGHDNKPLDKVKMIEMIDEGFFSYVRKLVEKDEKLKLIVTADHSTPCVNKGHSADPVPVLSLPGKDGKEKEQRFTEEQGMEGKKILGRKLLAEKFFGK